MTITYEINEDIRVRIVRYSGHIGEDDIQFFANRMRELSADQFKYTGFLIFEDGVDLSEVTAEVMLDLADALSDAAERAGGVGEVNVAAISENASILNELRLWREFMSQEKSLNYKLRVFPDIEEACQVIGLDQETCEAIKTADGFHKT